MCLPLIVVKCYFVIRLTIRMHSIFNIFTNKTESTTIYLMSLLSTTWGIVSLSFSRFSSIHFSIITILFLRGMLRISDLIRKFEHNFRIIVLFDTNFRTHIIMGRKEDSKQKTNLRIKTKRTLLLEKVKLSFWIATCKIYYTNDMNSND